MDDHRDSLTFHYPVSEHQKMMVRYKIKQLSVVP